MTMLASRLPYLLIATMVASTALAEEPGETILFAETAESATMADGVLTLSGVDGTIVWFSDRPFREAGKMPTSELITAWDKGNDSFEDDPPNAALTGMTKDGPESLVVELTDPVLNGDVLRFRYDVIGGEEVEIMEGVALLIDGLGILDTQ